MATYKVTAPDGHTYTINGPEGASDRDIAAVVAQKYPYSAYTSKQLEDIESAPTKVGDVMRNLGSSAIEGPKTLTNLFGATNPVSEYLSEKQKSLLEGLSPERQQEQRIDQELIERAKGTGILNEIGANLNPVARRPIESSVSGLLTSLPFILAPEGALATKGLGSLIGKKEILGSLMGIGSQKEQNYQDVLNKAIEERKCLQQYNRSPQTNEMAMSLMGVDTEQNADYIELGIPFTALGQIQPGDIIRLGAVVGGSGFDPVAQTRQLDSGFLGNSLTDASQSLAVLEGLQVRLATRPDDGRATLAQLAPQRYRLTWMATPTQVYHLEWSESATGPFQPLTGPGLPRTATGPVESYDLDPTALVPKPTHLFLRVRLGP